MSFECMTRAELKERLESVAASNRALAHENELLRTEIASLRATGKSFSVNRNKSPKAVTEDGRPMLRRVRPVKSLSRAEKVEAYLREHGGASIRSISKATGMSDSNARYLIEQMGSMIEKEHYTDAGRPRVIYRLASAAVAS